jgi:hypothetical protein
MQDLTSYLPDYVQDFVSQEDLIKILDQQKAQDASLEKLKTQLLAGWQGLGENVGIGSAGTDKAEIGGRSLPSVAEEFARKLQAQGVTDLSQAKFQPGQQAAWTAEGKGNVSLVATPDGRLVPVWGSSSDAGKARNIALALGSAWLAPGLSGMLGGGLGGAAGAGALLGGTRAAITGGDILKGALTGGITGGIGEFASPYLANLGRTASQAVGGDMLGKIASGAVQGAGRSAIGAAMTGDSIVDALLSGAAGGATSAGTDILVKGTNSTLNDYLKDVPAPVRNAVTSAATAGLLGKDIEKAAINSLVGSLMKELPSSTGGKKLADVTGADAIEGFFAPGGEGYYEGTIIPDWDVLPEEIGTRSIRDVGSVTQIDPLQELAFNSGMTPEGFYLEELDTTPDWAKVPTEPIQPLSITPEAASDVQRYDITADLPGLQEDFTLEDLLPGTGSSTQRTVNVTEGEPQTIEVTGKREGVIIPDWDVLPDVVTTPRSIRDVGPVTTISPGEKLEGTEIKEPDLSVGLPTAVTGTKTGTTKTTTDQKKNEIDWAKLFALLGAMNRPQEQKEQYQLANMPDYEDLMYGLSSGEMPYMRG